MTNETMRAELKPCPFCGRDDSFITYHDPRTILHPWYRIECDWCGCKGPGSDRGDHVAQWNARAAGREDIAAEIEGAE